MTEASMSPVLDLHPDANGYVPYEVARRAWDDKVETYRARLEKLKVEIIAVLPESNRAAAEEVMRAEFGAVLAKFKWPFHEPTK